MINNLNSEQSLCVLSGLRGVTGVILLIVSFAIDTTPRGSDYFRSDPVESRQVIECQSAPLLRKHGVCPDKDLLSAIHRESASEARFLRWTSFLTIRG